MTGPRRARSALFVVAGNLLVLAVLLLLVEGGLRLARFPFRPRWTPSENAIARFDETLGWSYRPGLATEMETESGVVPVYFDGQGIRVSGPGEEADPSRPSVLFVGGSFTMGHGLAFEDTFVGQFAARAEASGLQAVNLGVQGYGTDQAFLSLQRYLPRFDTRAVVYTFIPAHRRRNTNHDRRLLFPGAVFLGTKPKFALDPDGEPFLEKPPVRYEDYRHSWLVDLVRMRLGPKWPGAEERADELTRALVRAMGEYCRSRGVDFWVLDWRWTPGDAGGFEGLGVNVIDTLDGAPAGWSHAKLPGDEHPNARASKRVAELLVEALGLGDGERAAPPPSSP